MATIGPGPSGSNGSAVRNTGVVMRGNTVSAAPNRLRPSTRLLNDPSTVRSPNATSVLGNRSRRSSPAAWASAIKIC
ncbi:hypothetical protein D3C86_1958700 [compost metagenome]